MTKKNLAALMLAGAMMTVGSGAMAENYTKDENQADLGITVTANTSPTIDLTLTWSWGEGNEAPAFDFVWSKTDHKWVPSTAEGTNAGGSLSFTAKNDGSSVKTVTIANNGSMTPTWITLGTMPEAKSIPVGGGEQGIGNIDVNVNSNAKLDSVADNPNIGLVVTIQ